MFDVFVTVCGVNSYDKSCIQPWFEYIESVKGNFLPYKIIFIFHNQLKISGDWIANIFILEVREKRSPIHCCYYIDVWIEKKCYVCQNNIDMHNSSNKFTNQLAGTIKWKDRANFQSRKREKKTKKYISYENRVHIKRIIYARTPNVNIKTFIG